MNEMFGGATLYNGDLSKWDTSRVTNMNGMFWGAKSSIGTGADQWNFDQFNDMHSLFFRAKSFVADLSKWDTSRFTTIYERNVLRCIVFYRSRVLMVVRSAKLRA
jgi:surface protein